VFYVCLSLGRKVKLAQPLPGTAQSKDFFHHWPLRRNWKAIEPVQVYLSHLSPLGQVLYSHS
jgi:hypothetical protein